MAIVYPGAWYRQLPGKSTTLLGPRIINVHTMVWDLQNCENYFAQSGNPYSHFGTGPNGEVWQWQDLTYRAASDLDGNNFCISIENADKGAGYPVWSGSDVPRFTTAQAEAIAQLLAWLCARFGIPPQDVPDSLPERRGPGYHRHGINPWRVAGGVLYSNAYGKVCPGDRRIAQFHDEIMPRVRALLAPTPIVRNRKTMDLCQHPDGIRVDGFVVAKPTNPAQEVGEVFHYWGTNAADLVATHNPLQRENLGGLVKSVTAVYSGNDIVIWGHGQDNSIWSRVYSDATHAWEPWRESPAGDLLPI